MARLASLLIGLLLLAAGDGAGEVIETVPLPGLRAEVAALLVQGVAGGSLPIAAALFPRPAVGGAPGELGFLIELPTAPANAAPADAATAQRPLEVYAYAVDAAGEIAAHFAVTVADWPADGEGLKIAGRMDAAGAELSLRFLVWDPAERRYGMAVRRTAAGPAPLLVEECSGWSAAGSAAAELAQLSARPVLVSGESRRLRLDRTPPPDGWRVRLDGGGEASATAGAEVAATVGEGGEVRFAVPDLPAGVYQLSVAAAAGEPWASPSREVWLVPGLPPAGEGCSRSWPRVLRLARAGALGAPPAAPVVGVEARPDRGLAGDYQALLGRLAGGGDLARAAGELAELEHSAVGEAFDRLRVLFGTELGTARSLAERDPSCLLPLVALHADAYRIHHGAGRFALATHSRRVGAAIAELAAELLPQPEERALIAVAITGLADMVETRRASIEAQRLLEKALSLDDGLEAARLLLAVSYERKGRYLDARRELEALVAANSAHYEARVRLAILLRRLGEARQAEELLRSLVAEQPPGWLLLLGYQTLGQLLIRQDRLDEAVAALEEARRRLPEDQVIHLLLAFALDRGGSRGAVREVLAGMPLAQAAATARYRYSDQPAAALGLLRETLRQSLMVRLPALALALGEKPPGGLPG